MPFIHEEISGGTMGTADQDYFLDDKGEVTTDTEKAAMLLIRKGQDIPKDMADTYGIGKVAQQADGDEESEKLAKKPANKKAAPSKNKGVK
jgi:hypothetical protein